MKKSNVAKLFNTIKSGMCKRSPEILIGFGIAGMITTTVLAVKAPSSVLWNVSRRREWKLLSTNHPLIQISSVILK